jgi:AraC-like DNA-binding protein
LNWIGTPPGPENALEIGVIGNRHCAGTLARLAYQAAERDGIDANALLNSAGLSLDAIRDRSTRIAVSKQVRFVDLVAAAVDNPLFGFHLTKDLDLRELGWLYYVAASADTLGMALRRLERYCQIQNEAVRLAVDVGTTVSIQIRYAQVSRHSEFHQIGAFIAMILALVRHITANWWFPTDVCIAHRIGDKKRVLGLLLNAAIHDGTGVDEIRLPAESWKAGIVRADPFLQNICVKACEAAVALSRDTTSEIRIEVENAIAELLPHGQAAQSAVAKHIGMSQRTLARRLAEEHCSFSELLSGVRRGLADRYLTNRSLSISEIAWLLGYTEVSTFTRAFQRWTGAPPSATRASTRG